MPRSLLVPALCLLAACQVDRTPQRLLDPRDPAAVERREAEGELAARLGAFREALARGDRADAVGALALVPATHVIGLDENGGRPRYGPAGLTQVLQRLQVPRGAVARTPDLRVQADPREGVGWFATHLEVRPVTGPDVGKEWLHLRVSGVFQQIEGEWRLTQVHLSRPELPPAADTTAADSPASRDGGAAPPEDE